MFYMTLLIGLCTLLDQAGPGDLAVTGVGVMVSMVKLIFAALSGF